MKKKEIFIRFALFHTKLDTSRTVILAWKRLIDYFGQHFSIHAAERNTPSIRRLHLTDWEGGGGVECHAQTQLGDSGR